MPAWNELLDEFAATPQDQQADWLKGRLLGALKQVGSLRNNRNVMFYGSAFLQKPQLPAPTLIVMNEDINGLMSVVYGMDCSKGLTLILHTPGGSTNATETFVAYLRSKFKDIEVAVPTFAMSAGTMISLAADRIIMGRQSQLGPIDPQFPMGMRQTSARAVVDQFNMAKAEIRQDAILAHAWAPILANLGPALLQEALDAIEYSERMVRTWLEAYMLRGKKNAKKKARAIASHFNDATTHKSHGRRIDRDEARAQGVTVEDLEVSQDLQDAVLTAYHVFTILVQSSVVSKGIFGSNDRTYLKNVSAQLGHP